MEAAATEMCNPPPTFWEARSFPLRKINEVRNVHEQKDLLLGMCSVHMPEFLPAIIYSFRNHYDRGRNLTHAQLNVVRTIYAQLCWEGVIEDPNRKGRW